MRRIAALLLCFTLPAFAQPPGVTSLGNSSPQTSGLTVGTVTVRGAWGRRVASLPLKPGDALTPESLSAAMEALRDEITRTSAVSYLKTFGEFEVLYIGAEFEQSTASTVNVVLVPHFVDVSLVKVGDKVVPLPRSAPPPFEDVPRVVRILRPSALAAYDRKFGTSVTGAIDTDVPAGADAKINLSADARVSLDESFHEARGALGYLWKREAGALRAAGLSVGYEDDRTPLAAGVKESSGLNVSGELMWKLAANTRLYLDAIDDDSSRARVMYETIPRAGGFLRAALWGGKNETGVLRVGWEREFPVAPSQTVGVEFTAGAGHIWGSAAATERFFGGNPAQKFLYDAPAAKTLTDLPGGPILRSFGEGAAGIDTAGGLVGGTGYWHVNVDLTVPIAGLSRALIPNDSAGIEDIDGNDLTLKQLMARQVDVTGPSFMQSALEAQGLSSEAAQARTHEVMDEIRPAAHYIINDANLFAVKPLLLVDAAGLSAPEGSRNWLAVGLGVQVTVVTAKFEAGYARTVHGPVAGERGAPFARLVFQRLW